MGFDSILLKQQPFFSFIRMERGGGTCNGVSSPVSSEILAINNPHSVLIPTAVTYIWQSKCDFMVGAFCKFCFMGLKTTIIKIVH